jgi:hypothetical protein
VLFINCPIALGTDYTVPNGANIIRPCTLYFVSTFIWFNMGIIISKSEHPDNPYNPTAYKGWQYHFENKNY